MASPTASIAATGGLVAAYGFEESSGQSVLDAGDYGLTGTISGNAARTTAGKFGSALSFDGVDDRVDIPDAEQLHLTTGMTMEAWVRPASSSGWRTVVLKERPGALSYALYSSEGSGKPDGIVNAGGADREAIGPTALTLNTWTHLATTYDGTNLRTFVNGVQVAVRATTGSVPVSSSALRIGGNTVWSEYFSGQIDEVRIYNRALTVNDIQTDMTTPVGAGKLPPPPPDLTFRTSGPLFAPPPGVLVEDT